MKSIYSLVTLAVLALPALSFAEIIQSPQENKYPVNAKVELSGEDAAAIRSAIGTRTFFSKKLGIQSLSCSSADTCEIAYTGSMLARSENYENRPEYNPDLNPFFKDFKPGQLDRMISIPGASMYYHLRNEIVENDKKLYKFLAKNKKLKKEVVGDDTFIHLETKNLKLSCREDKTPEHDRIDACMPHGGCLPGIFSKKFRITHECRTYMKIKIGVSSNPLVIDPNHTKVEVMELQEGGSLSPLKDVKVKLNANAGTTVTLDHLTIATPKTDENGSASFEKEFTYLGNDVNESSTFLRAFLSVSSSTVEKYKVAGCNEDPSLYLSYITLNTATGKVIKSDCSYEQELEPGRNVLNFKELQDPAVKCVLTGRGKVKRYEWDAPNDNSPIEPDYRKFEPVSSAVRRIKDICQSSN